MYKLNPFTYSFSRSGKAHKIFLEEPIEIQANELVAIVGPSGGGKSTLLKILKGIIPEYSSGELVGDITFEGEKLHGQHFEKNLSRILYLFQNPYSQLIYPHPEEEFLFSMENFNFTKDEMNAQKEKFDELFNLKNIWGKKNTNLSNGECQKLVLASMLAINPKVLLLDEPTAFLDPDARREFYDYLAKIKKDRLVIIVDHHVKEISHIVDRVIHVAADGKITSLPVIQDAVSKSNLFDFSNLNLSVFKNLSLNLSDINFSYDSSALLFDKLNLNISGGEIIAIKGRNGIGKSTLFKLIAGITNPSKGSVKFNKNKNASNVTGFIFQNPEAHFFYDTIDEELQQSFKNIKDPVVKENLLKRFFYDLDLKKSPFLLSEGEKRRLSILMTVFLGKAMLLYDEPTFGQDLSSVTEISNLMLELKKLGIIQIFISHDEDFISKTADRVYILEAGGMHEVSRA